MEATVEQKELLRIAVRELERNVVSLTEAIDTCDRERGNWLSLRDRALEAIERYKKVLGEQTN